MFNGTNLSTRQNRSASANLTHLSIITEMITREKAEEIFQDIIRNKKAHQDYDRTVQYAEKLKKLITGVGIETELKRFVMREDDAMFKQRVTLSQLTTPSICNTLYSPAKKIARVRPLVDSIQVESGDSKADNESENKAVEKVRSGMAQYYGGMGVDKFMEDRYIPNVYADPNAWVLTTFDNYNELWETARPYPTIISSADSFNFEIINNETVWFVVKRKILYNSIQTYRTADSLRMERKQNEGNLFSFYTSEDNIEYQQIDPSYHRGGNDSFSELPSDIDSSLIVKGVEQRLYKFNAGEVYLVTYYEHKTGVVPVKRIGVIPDEATNGRTCLSPLEPAMPYLMKSIKAVSELDINITLHTFLQKISYQPKCKGESNVITCNGGATPDGGVCKVCNGAGFITNNSGQDAIYLGMPDIPEDAFQLDKLTHYVQIPIDIVKFLDDFCDKIEEKALRAVYNSDTFVKTQFNDTATGVNVNMQSVYDALYPIKCGYESMRTHITRCIAGLLDVRKVRVLFIFPRDFKLRSLEDLLATLKMAQESNASTFIKQDIANDIAEVLYMDRPDELKRIRTRQQFNPFDGKTKEEIDSIFVSNTTTMRDKVLWSLSARIFTEIEQEYPKESGKWFYDMAYDKQLEIVNKKVEELEQEIKEEPTAVQFGANGAPMDAVRQGDINTNDNGGEGNGSPANASTDVTTNALDMVQAEAQAKLKGTVGGVQGILEIQRSVSDGITDVEAAVVLLEEIYGFSTETARRIVGKPKPKEQIVASITQAQQAGDGNAAPTNQ